MYLNHFCFVLVLVSVSASFFDQELPLYLSDDDILVSQIPRVSKRSISEHDKPKITIHNHDQDKGNEEDVEDGAESGLVFIPSFGRRNKRSIPENLEKTKRETPEQRPPSTYPQKNEETKQGSESEKEAESGLVFLPSFGRRNKRSIPEDEKKTKQETLAEHGPPSTNTQRNEDTKESSESEKEAESGLVFLPSFGRRNKRSVSEDEKKTKQETLGQHTPPRTLAQKHEDIKEGSESEKEAESGLVFLPSFGRRNKRSIPENPEKIKQATPAEQRPPSTYPQKNEDTKQGSESEKEAESGLVFLPSFGRRHKRSIPEDEKKTKQETLGQHTPPRTYAQKKEDTKQGSESQKEAESGLVFLPSFGRRSRRSVNEKEDLLHEESNIVFLPSFRRNGIRRFRRDVIKRSVEEQTESDTKKETGPLVTEQNEELSDSDTVNGEESGLVFLPSFGRSRRSAEDSRHTAKQEVLAETNEKIKRDVIAQIPDKKKGKDDWDQNEDDETEEESGLVFIPSFGRRQRRDASSTAIPVKKEDTTNKKDDKVTEKTINAQESGLVFLPSFNRRSRREISTEKPKEVTENSKSLDEEESGLVFLPSFGRRTRRFVLY